VLYDKELSFSARCVYAALADRVGSGATTSIGMRLLAKRLGASKTTVCDAVKELVDRGHVKVRPFGKQRAIYHLTSNRFGYKQRALDAGESITEELISKPRRRLATAKLA